MKIIDGTQSESDDYAFTSYKRGIFTILFSFSFNYLFLSWIELDIYKKITDEENSNLVKIIDNFEFEKFYIIIMEYCEQGTLTNYIRNKFCGRLQ